MRNLICSYLNYLGRSTQEQRERFVSSWLRSVYKTNYKVIDLGCYDGAVTERILKKVKVKEVIGVDIDKTALMQARRKGIKTVHADLNFKLPISSHHVNIIICLETVEHLINLDVFFGEVYRILKPGGSLFISTENLASWSNIFLLLLGIQPITGPYLSSKHIVGFHPVLKASKKMQNLVKTRPPHLNVMTAKSLKELLLKNNFKILEFVGLGYYPLPPLFWRPLTMIDKYHAGSCLFHAIKNED